MAKQKAAQSPTLKAESTLQAASFTLQAVAVTRNSELITGFLYHLYQRYQLFNSLFKAYFCQNLSILDIVNPQAEEYASRYTSPDDALLAEIAASTAATHAHAHMLSGHVQGKFLEMISCLLQPRRVLEIGTFTGYSAICLAKGLLKDGKIHTIELRDEDASVARTNFNRSIDAGTIILHVGNALSIIPGLNETWDLVFIDADKVNYTQYYQLVLPMVRPGGLIIADNVLFHGQVLQSRTGGISGKNAKAIHAFNEYVLQDARVEKVMLTVRDGLLMIRKK